MLQPAPRLELVTTQHSATMASQLPPSPPPPTPTTTTATITGLSADLLREILVRLPDLPSLVRAAFACRPFCHAVRSSPAFRRSFRALHPPPLLALFLEPNFEVVPVFPSPCGLSDPDLVAADFFAIRLSRHGDADATGWEIESRFPSANGFLILDKVSRGTRRRAAYSPLTQALDLFLGLPAVDIRFEFYTLFSEDGQGLSRVVCVSHERQSAVRAAVLSSDTKEWQIFPKTALQLCKSDRSKFGTVMRGLICWQDWMDNQIVVLDTKTFQFSLIDLPTPTPLKTVWDESTYKLGQTKDGKLCIVDIMDNILVSQFMTADGDNVVERWMVYKKFPLHSIVKEFTGCSIEEEGRHVRVGLVALIDGFVYLSIFYCRDHKLCELYLALCLETSEIRELFKGGSPYNEQAHPYVMGWPPSLIQSKEESETEVTGNRVADDGPVCTIEASSTLVAALKSFSQALMNDCYINKKTVAELDAFLRPTEDHMSSLMSKITTLDAQLRKVRDRILRLRT
ncbi:unnamed protein product [Alopecurus aequalis]